MKRIYVEVIVAGILFIWSLCNSADNKDDCFYPSYSWGYYSSSYCRNICTYNMA